MVHGYHIVICAYGFWLPNDPRGSWSDFVGKWELLRFGESTRGSELRHLAQLTPDELNRRDAARKSLKYPPVQFDGSQALAIGKGFATACSDYGYNIWACSILPEHTHLVIGRHRYIAEMVTIKLKAAATRSVIERGIHPLMKYAKGDQRPPRMWSEHQWIAFLESADMIDNAINYVIENPMKEGKRRQDWPFVKPFSGIEPGCVKFD